MNATIRTAGACTPTPATATMKPSVAARLYAGAVDATAMTRFEMYPIALRLRPLWPGSVVSSAGCCVPVTVALSIRDPSPRCQRAGAPPAANATVIPW